MPDDTRDLEERPEAEEGVAGRPDDQSEAVAEDADRDGGGGSPPVADDEEDRLRTELADLRELYLRKLAEFDNFRKRTEREREELVRTAGESLVRDLVPVLDNFERALQHSGDGDTQAFRQGVEMIARQLWDVLQRQGLEEVDPKGEPFRPELHEAVQGVEGTDEPPGTVVWVAGKGYLFGGRLLRPAMVGVAVESGPAPESEPPSAATAEEDEAS